VAGGDLAGGKSTAADLGAWLIFEDEPGQGLRPPKGRTWGRREVTPVVTATGGAQQQGVAGRADRHQALGAAAPDLPGARQAMPTRWPTERVHRGNGLVRCLMSRSAA
jgi:hypothetical protein